MALVFPADVRGWLLESEGHALYRWARGKRVLEVGSYCGRSTICLAQSASEVVSIDPHDGRGTGEMRHTWEEFRGNLMAFGVWQQVTCLWGTFDAFTLDGSFDGVFIDGAHDYESVASDIRCALAVLRPHGELAFHDYYCGAPGVVSAVNELLLDGWRVTDQVARVAILRRRTACQAS